MAYPYLNCTAQVHRLVPSRYPPVLLFDWVESESELLELAALEGATNDRLLTEYGDICLVAKEDWVSGPGATPVMAAFTHIGYPSRFTDGSYGVYYAATSLSAAISETIFHREIFLKASNEPPTRITMREYLAKVSKPLVDLQSAEYKMYLQPELETYSQSQLLARQIRIDNEWGLFYPSVRYPGGQCVAIFRPPALSLPKQGRHLDYIWDGKRISDVNQLKVLAFEVE